MKLIPIILVYTCLATIMFIGIPISMKITTLSQSKNAITLQSNHESIISLVKKSKLSLACPFNPNQVCVRPIDYSHLKANMPIRLEKCESSESTPSCDDLSLNLRFSSKEVLLTGLRL
jgi:hypothetical protein